VLDQANRNLAPNLAEPCEQVGPIEPQPSPRLHRYHDRIFCVRGAGSKLRFGRREHGLIAPEVADVAAEKRENSGRVYIVDRPDRVQLAQAGPIGSILDVVQPAARDDVIWILLLSGKPPAALFHFPQRQPEALPYPFQTNTCRHG
jgi:hypothetical protein